MKVLVIPDVHLKPEIFDQAEKIMDRLISFARKYPHMLFC